MLQWDQGRNVACAASYLLCVYIARRLRRASATLPGSVAGPSFSLTGSHTLTSAQHFLLFSLTESLPELRSVFLCALSMSSVSDDQGRVALKRVIIAPPASIISCLQQVISFLKFENTFTSTWDSRIPSLNHCYAIPSPWLFPFTPAKMKLQ